MDHLLKVGGGEGGKVLTFYCYMMQRHAYTSLTMPDREMLKEPALLPLLSLTAKVKVV